VHDLAEAPRDRGQLLGRQFLVAEKQHKIFEPQAAQLGNNGIRQIGTQLYAADLRADRAGHAPHHERRCRIIHCKSLSTISW